ncbi:MAG: immunoglobulin domain-containing protein [Burkholderiales bacterium]
MNIALTNFQPPANRFAQWLLWCLLAGLLAACGGGGGGGGGGGAAIAPSITAQPASVSVAAGSEASFSVTATGSDPLSYQWQKNGTPINGATAASYTTPATATADNGAQFTVVVSNTVATVTSDVATLTVGVPVGVSITTQPGATSVVAPNTATFTVAATGTAPLMYQWTKNGAAIAGANGASYTTPATVTATDDGALFAVVVTNAAGPATSDNATLTVTDAPSAPVIATQPANATVNAGQTASFTVVATGTAPFTYQWSENGSAIAGATAASYTTPPTIDADTGATFRVVVTNAVTSVASADATLTVTPLPVAVQLTAQPVSVNVTAGQAASFSVAATGTAPITYQWQRNGTAIAGATSATYTLPATTIADNGAQFRALVSNAVNSLVSNAATLTVDAAATPPSIATQPANTSVLVGQTATFSVVATGTAPFTYQWRKNGTTIAGATAASYTTPAAITADNNALFSVVVSNGSLPNATSANAKLTVGVFVPVTIATQPTSASTAYGATATFTVAANGTAPIAYQWYRDGVAITGATSASYTTAVVSFADDQAKFTAVASNGTNSSVTSGAAVLTVTLPSTPVVQVSAGYGHSIALRSSGAIYSWAQWYGAAVYNALAGAGQNSFSAGAPVRGRSVDNTPFLGVASISAGQTHSALVRNDGTVWVWGDVGASVYGYCPIGDGACIARYYPTQTKDASGVPFTGASQVAAGLYFNVAVKTDGSVWSWGKNDYGQLGDGTTTFRLNPVQVTDPSSGGFFSGVARVAVSPYHAVAMKTDGTVYAWGRAGSGQIGDGSVSASVAVPKRVEVTPGVPLTGVIAVAAGEVHSLALKADGTVWAWGENGNGALGDGTTTDRTRATVMHDTAGTPIGGVIAIAAGTQFSVLLKSDGTMLTTGQNSVGQLGDNSTATYQINPVTVKDAAGTVFGNVTGVSTWYQHTVVMRGDGTVWTWGLNSNYQLGDTTNVNRRNPVPAPAYTP